MEGKPELEHHPQLSQFPMKYTKEQVVGKLTDDELEELNKLVEEFPDYSENVADPRYQRWLKLDSKAFDLDQASA